MKKSLEKFIEETKGTQVDVPWVKEPSRLKGQCVSLIQVYNEQCLEQPAKARGNAKDWIKSYVDEGLGHIVSEPKTGDIIVFPNEANGYGHIAIYVDGKLYDQNNLRHDNGMAGYGEIFSNDFTILRPNTDVIINEPSSNIQYLNLNPKADTWRVYPMNVAPVKGNECKILYPSRFNGLSYTIKGYTQANVAIIETRDYGQVQIYIGQDVSNMFDITNSPIYGLVK